MLKKTVKITTPARLHFGFLELNNNRNAPFGGIGLAIDKFHTKIVVKNNTGLKYEGIYLEKASFFLETFCKKKKIKPNFHLKIERCAPQHIGLGSGTQLALCIGNAISYLKSINLDEKKIAKILNRSSRSKVGLITYKHGGFIIDLETKNNFFTSIEKVFFPEDWKILLIKDEKQGLHGKNETDAFKKINNSNKSNNLKLRELVLLNLYPSLIEKNFNGFCKTINKFQNIMGKRFNIYQGGLYSSSEVSKVLNFLKKKKIIGLGQTSWGPTGFAFFPRINEAEQMKRKLKKRFSSCKNLEFIICSGKNSGADIQLR